MYLYLARRRHAHIVDAPPVKLRLRRLIDHRCRAPQKMSSGLHIDSVISGTGERNQIGVGISTSSPQNPDPPSPASRGLGRSGCRFQQTSSDGGCAHCCTGPFGRGIFRRLKSAKIVHSDFPLDKSSPKTPISSVSYQK